MKRSPMPQSAVSIFPPSSIVRVTMSGELRPGLPDILLQSQLLLILRGV